jgi:hypothetical protein
MNLKPIALSLLLATTVNVQQSQAFPYNDLESVVAWKSMDSTDKAGSLMCQKVIKAAYEKQGHKTKESGYFMACTDRVVIGSFIRAVYKNSGKAVAKKMFADAEKAAIIVDKKVAKIKMDLEPCGTARSGFASCD